MKSTYDQKKDALFFEFKSGTVAESEEEKPGVILDYNAEGELIGLEILDASKRVDDARCMLFQVTE